MAVDGAALSREAYTLTPNAEDTRMTVASEHLGVSKGTEPFTVTVTTRFKPQDNLELSGLYKSGGNFCTQCEAEGFRRITFFQDRPDVMSVFDHARDRGLAQVPRAPLQRQPRGLQFPFEDDPEALHGAREDPVSRSPRYLFALVAGTWAWWRIRSSL